MHRILFGILLVTCPAAAQLSGLYTINPLAPTAGTNYASFAAAHAALQSQGISGPTTFQIYDDAGPYTENNPVGTNISFGSAVLYVRGNMIPGLGMANPLTFEAAPGENVVIDASGKAFGIMLHGCQYVTVRGLEVMNAVSDCISIYTDLNGGATSDRFGNQVLECRIHGAGGCGINVYQNGTVGGMQIAFNGTVIRNNFIWNCQITNGGINNTWRLGYLNERRSKNAIIENNTFFANTGVGANFGVYVTYYAAGVGGPAASFRNNLLVKTIANGAVIRHVEANGQPTLQDYNVYDDTSGGVFLAGASGTAATFATFQQNFAPRDANGRSGPSALVNPTMGDLHLGAGSVAIDAGTPILGVTVDIDGQLRPIGLTFDAGADEASLALAAVIPYGMGCAGAAGTPTLSSTQLPTLGNLGFTVDVMQGAPSSQAWLFAALAPQNPPLPLGGACNLHLELASFQLLITLGFGPFGPVATSPSGTASFALPVPNIPSLAGNSVYFQAAVSDPTSPLGVTVTNGLQALIN